MDDKIVNKVLEWITAGEKHAPEVVQGMLRMDLFSNYIGLGAGVVLLCFAVFCFIQEFRSKQINDSDLGWFVSGVFSLLFGFMFLCPCVYNIYYITYETQAYIVKEVLGR